MEGKAMKRVCSLLALLLVLGIIALPLLAQVSEDDEEEFEIRRGAKAFKDAPRRGFVTDEEPIRLVSDEEVVYCYIIFTVLGSSALYLAYRGQRR